MMRGVRGGRRGAPPEINKEELTIWVSPTLIAQWRSAAQESKKKGRPYFYSDRAMLPILQMRLLFVLPYRQTQGLIATLFRRLEIDTKVPSYSQLCRRASRLDLPLPTAPEGKITDLVLEPSGLSVFAKGKWQPMEEGWHHICVGFQAEQPPMAVPAAVQEEPALV